MLPFQMEKENVKLVRTIKVFSLVKILFLHEHSRLFLWECKLIKESERSFSDVSEISFGELAFVFQLFL